MRRRLVLAAVLLAAGWRADGAVDPLAAVRARLAPTDVLRGVFVQTKKLAGFRNRCGRPVASCWCAAAACCG